MNSLRCDSETPHDSTKLYGELKAFYRIMEQRRKSTLSLSKGSIAMVEIVHSLEKLNFSLHSSHFIVTDEKFMLLQTIQMWLEQVRLFIGGERDDIPQYPGEIHGDATPDEGCLYTEIIMPSGSGNFIGTEFSFGAWQVDVVYYRLRFLALF